MRDRVRRADPRHARRYHLLRGRSRHVGRHGQRAPRRRRFVEADLRSWQPSFEFDVAVGFETIEHLDSYDVYLDWVRRARRHIVVSVPIVPTKDDNVFHVHDFERDDLVQLVTASPEWRLFQYFDQPWEHSCVYVFTRAGVVLAEPHKLGVRRSWKSRWKGLVKSAASFRLRSGSFGAWFSMELNKDLR